MIMERSIELNIDLNAKLTKLSDGETPFHLACINGPSKLVEILIQNSKKFNIDINSKTYRGQTGFHYACANGNYTIVEKMIDISEDHKLDLTVKDINGDTGFQLAKRGFRTQDVVAQCRNIGGTFV